MSYHGIPIPDSVFKDEVKRYQRLYPHKTVWDIAEHFRMGSPTGIKVIQGILAEPGMRRFRPGIDVCRPVKSGPNRAAVIRP